MNSPLLLAYAISRSEIGPAATWPWDDATAYVRAAGPTYRLRRLDPMVETTHFPALRPFRRADLN